MITLVKDKKIRLRYLSVRLQLLAMTVITVFMAMPEEQQQALLTALGFNPAWLVLLSFGGAVFAAFVNQKELAKEMGLLDEQAEDD